MFVDSKSELSVWEVHVTFAWCVRGGVEQGNLYAQLIQNFPMLQKSMQIIAFPPSYCIPCAQIYYDESIE